MIKKHYHKKIWLYIGFIINLSQMIEYNLANILALNEILCGFEKTNSMYTFEYNELLVKSDEWYKKLDKCELGKILNQKQIHNIFTDEFKNHLDSIRQDRNYFVHTFFKNDLKTKEFQNKPKQFIPRLEDLINRMNFANDKLVSIFDNIKKEVKMIY